LITCNVKKVVKSALKNLFKKAGLEIIPTWRLPDLNFTCHLQELFKFLDVRCVLDVGAHRGEYRNLLRNKVGFEGLIISFEPIKENISILKRSAENDPNWEIEPFALGACNMQLPIHVMASSTFSSFLMPNSQVIDTGDGNSVQRVEICEVKSLDSIAKVLKSKYQARNIFRQFNNKVQHLGEQKRRCYPKCLCQRTTNILPWTKENS
jgi:FkbM family methyltransferase